MDQRWPIGSSHLPARLLLERLRLGFATLGDAHALVHEVYGLTEEEIAIVEGRA